MSNIATALKEEISRIARKEIRTETESLKQANSRYRAEIAELKRRLAPLEKAAQIKPKKVIKASEGEAEPVAKAKTKGKATAKKAEFDAAGLRAHREKLGLSAADMAKLLKVSAATMYNWELGKTTPRDSQLATIAAAKKLGKRAAAAALAVDEPAAENESTTETEPKAEG